jgi:xylulokinase
MIANASGPADAVLAIDLGTSSVKCFVVDSEGVVLGRGSRSYPVARPRAGWAEQDPDQWWEAVVSAVREALAGSAAAIRAIGLTGQMHGTVVIDNNRRHLRPAIIWEDGRAADQVDVALDRTGRDRYLRLTGSPPAVGFQIVSLLWLRTHEPDAWSQISNVLLPKDYIRFRLTGALQSDPSDASGTGLFDVTTRAWSGEILDALGIPTGWMPAIVPSHAAAARLSAEAAALLALPTGLPVTGGAGDAPAAALAAGGPEPGTLLLTISTGSQSMVTTPRPAIDHRGRVHAWCHALHPDSGAGWYVMAATMASGLALRWLRDEVFALPEAGAQDLLESWASEIPPGAGGLVFAPYLIGERSPLMDPHARGAFLGLTARHDRRHLTRAVMEGAVLALQHATSVLDELREPAGQITLSGGGARSLLWAQIVADVFDRPVRPIQEVEGSALGAAILAGSAAGWGAPAEIARKWLRLGDPVLPDPEAGAIYRTLTTLFRDFYPRHREDFSILGRIEGEQAAQA